MPINACYILCFAPHPFGMTTASPITLSLVNEPRIYHGFWHSRGTSFPPGPALTVNTTVYAFLTSGLALFTAWVASRAWCIINVLIFRSIYRRTMRSLQESQCAALLANTRAPLAAFLTACHLTHRGGPKHTLFMIVFAAVFILALNAAIPVFVALFPIRRGGLLAATNCGFDSAFYDWNYNVKVQRFSDAALSAIDQNVSVAIEGAKARTLAPLPQPTQSYIRQCPTGAICHPDYPFTFSSSYTLTSQHFGLNIDAPFSIQVSDTCYRPIDAIYAIPGSNPLRYGLYYGPSVVTGQLTDYTTFMFLEQGLAPGYVLVTTSNLANESAVSSLWRPNSTLLLGGDTTILVYFVGWIQQDIPSNDPVFATSPVPDPDGVYRAQHVVAPIVCDTKYQFCADKQGECSPIGPRSHVLNWMKTTKTGSTWEDLRTFFNGSSLSPPLALTAFGSGAIASGQTLQQAWVQSDPGNTTVARELGRLSHAGMAALASFPQAAAVGYWNVGQGSSMTPAHGLCNNVVIESTTAVSILLTPYWLFLPISLLIIVISYADLFGATRLRRWKEYREAWKLYSVGQLHRQVAEQQCGTLQNAHPTTAWPDLRAGHANGFAVLERNGSKYLASRTFVLPLDCVLVLA